MATSVANDSGCNCDGRSRIATLPAWVAQFIGEESRASSSLREPVFRLRSSLVAAPSPGAEVDLGGVPGEVVASIEQ